MTPQLPDSGPERQAALARWVALFGAANGGALDPATGRIVAQVRQERSRSRRDTAGRPQQQPRGAPRSCAHACAAVLLRDPVRGCCGPHGAGHSSPTRAPTHPPTTCLPAHPHTTGGEPRERVARLPGDDAPLAAQQVQPGLRRPAAPRRLGPPRLPRLGLPHCCAAPPQQRAMHRWVAASWSRPMRPQGPAPFLYNPCSAVCTSENLLAVCCTLVTREHQSDSHSSQGGDQRSSGGRRSAARWRRRRRRHMGCSSLLAGLLPLFAQSRDPVGARRHAARRCRRVPACRTGRLWPRTLSNRLHCEHQSDRCASRTAALDHRHRRHRRRSLAAAADRSERRHTHRMSYYLPAAAGRQAALVPASSALLFIDVQRYNCSQDGAIFQALTDEQRQVRRAECVPPAGVRARPRIVRPAPSRQGAARGAAEVATGLPPGR